MPYLIDATDRPGQGETRQRIRPQHLDYLERRANMLLAAGAKLSDDGLSSIGTYYLLAVEERAAAQAFLAADPYAAADVFGAVTITRVRKGFFDFTRVIA